MVKKGLAKKERSNYINTLTHKHGSKIHINSDGYKQHDRFTNIVMFEFSWNVMSKDQTGAVGKDFVNAQEQIFQEKRE